MSQEPSVRSALPTHSCQGDEPPRSLGRALSVVRGFQSILRCGFSCLIELVLILEVELSDP